MWKKKIFLPVFILRQAVISLTDSAATVVSSFGKGTIALAEKLACGIIVLTY